MRKQISIALLACLCFASAVVLADPATGDAVIARGKGVEVHRSQLTESWTIYLTKYQRAGRALDEPRETVEPKLLKHIIETQILLGRATPEEKAQAQSDAEQLAANQRKRFASEEDFNGWLTAMGMTPEIYRRRVVEQRTCELVIARELRPAISIRDEELQTYYEQNAAAFDKPEQVWVRQILFPTLDPSTGQALPEEQKRAKEKLAHQVKARLNMGEDLMKLYQEFSEDPGAKQETRGDDLLLYAKGQMGPEFDAVVFALKPNAISDVVASPKGYHIVRVSTHEPATRPALAEVGPRLREFLVRNEIKKRMPEYLETIKKEAGVEMLPGPSEESSKNATTKAAN